MVNREPEGILRSGAKKEFMYLYAYAYKRNSGCEDESWMPGRGARGKSFGAGAGGIKNWWERAIRIR